MTLNVRRSFEDKWRQAFEDFSDSLFEASYTPLYPLSCRAYVSSEPFPFRDRFCGEEMDIEKGAKWAQETFDCAWFHITGEKTEAADFLLLDCGGEGLVYTSRGEPVRAVTCVASDFDSGYLGPAVKRAVPLTPELINEGKIDLWMDCAANDLFGNMQSEARAAELYAARVNPNIRRLAYDVQVLLTAADFGGDEDYSREIYNAIEEIKQAPVTEERAGELCDFLAPLLKRQTDEDFTYYAIGHAHLDLAWLWPIRETKRKGLRTFATQIKNIEGYGDYIFGASQAQLYTWIKEESPLLYGRVRALADEGRWDVQGATWVEPDSNLISGESLVRQFFYGKKFFREEFGMDMKIFWVPDSFGYSACIPQVMKLAGVPYFLTQKMSWNTFNKFPYHSFYWQGLDGTSVLTHMLPENTYNSPMRGDLLKKGEATYAERKISRKSMSLFGIGDGGAGPGMEHIERAIRYKSLKTMPKVKMSRSLDFFKELDDGKTPYPTYSGELYLEKHQGTYTTRSRTKFYNRKCEFALRNYELLAARAESRGIAPPISHSELEDMWKEVLLYQFHDILPGSSINRVYEECEKRYRLILNRLTNAAGFIARALYPTKTLVNLNSFTYEKKIQTGDKWYSVTLPPLGAAPLSPESELTEFSAKCTYNTLENDKVKVTFKDGFVASLFDKELNREFIPGGEKAAAVSQYDDYGDCWDIQGAKADYLQTKKTAHCTAFKTRLNGAEAYAQARYEIGDCVIFHRFSLIDGDSALYCKTDIDACQKNSMLRMAFPLEVDTEECSFNIQFGHIIRRTTENNSIELAQFEVSAQKFVDMSDNLGGISFINDCKYGYRVKNGVIDLNLLRAPEGGPGRNVDQGRHTVHWALAPHKGAIGRDTYARAYDLNNPPILTSGKLSGGEREINYTCDNENIILEAVKIPEDGRGLIVRLYNSSDEEQQGEVSLMGYSVKEITDINESRLSEKTDGKLRLHGFELINLRFI